MSDFIKQIFYLVTVLLLGNSGVVLLLLVNLLSTSMNNLLALILSLLTVCVYHIKVWLHLRSRFQELDDKCCRLLL
jgi:hypothetical protein